MRPAIGALILSEQSTINGRGQGDNGLAEKLNVRRGSGGGVGGGRGGGY